MNSLKTMLMVAVLAVVVYGVYVSINSSPVEAPPEVAEDWSAGPPQVSLPGVGEGASGFAVGDPNGYPPSGAPPTSDRSNELSPLRPFSDRAPSPPFSPAPMPPEIASNLNAAPPVPPAPAPAYTSPGTPPLPPPTNSNGDLAGSPTNPPIPNFDTGKMPPLPPEGSAYVTPGMDESPKTKSNEIRPQFAEFLAGARRDLEQGRFRETLGILSSRYGEPDQTAAEAAALTELLDQVAGTVIYSTEHLLEPAYVVQTGETLPQIAEKYGVTTELLAKINAIPDPMNLQPGQELKVVRGPFRAVANLEEHQLVLWLQDLYAGRFPIGVGTDKPDLAGSFEVLEKNREPAYYSPTNRAFDPGDPLNPLGKRLLRLDDSVAIHGTNDEGSVGQTGGPGAIRLGDRDAEDVFDILSLGSRVVIQR